MLKLIPFTILLLLQTQSLELMSEFISDTFNEEELRQFYEDINNTAVDSSHLMKNDWEVVGIPKVIVGLHKESWR